MKLKDWAKQQNICYMTAIRWFHSGKMPVPAFQTETGTILVDTTKKDNIEPRIVVYARVSNQSRKAEMDCQVDRIMQYCAAKGYSIDKIYKEVASGMNDNRKELWKMLDSKPTLIIVENKDRLTRFGFNYLDRLLKNQDCIIEVMNKDYEDETDLIKDLVSIITSFCCRLYGARRGQNKAKRMTNIINE